MLHADSPTTFRKSAISFRKNIDCETFRNVAFLSVFPNANGECSKSCRQKVRFVMFSCYFLRIVRQSSESLCPVFSRKVFFRGEYYIGYANTFRYKYDVNNNSNTDHWCNLRERERERQKKKQQKKTKKRTENMELNLAESN